MFKWLLSFFGYKNPVDTTESVFSQKKDQFDNFKTMQTKYNTPTQSKKVEPVKVNTKVSPSKPVVKTDTPVTYVDDVPVYVQPAYVPPVYSSPIYDTNDYSSRCDSSSYSSSSSYDSGSSCSGYSSSD